MYRLLWTQRTKTRRNHFFGMMTNRTVPVWGTFSLDAHETLLLDPRHLWYTTLHVHSFWSTSSAGRTTCLHSNQGEVTSGEPVECASNCAHSSFSCCCCRCAIILVNIFNFPFSPILPTRFSNLTKVVARKASQVKNFGGIGQV